jgi:hypothetical protein
MKRFAFLLVCLSVLPAQAGRAQTNTDPEVDGAKWVKSTGVPVYPGAVLARSRAWEHGGAFAGGRFAWTCNDTVEQVVAFLENAMKAKAEEKVDKRSYARWSEIRSTRGDVIAGRQTEVLVTVRVNAGEEGPLIEGGGKTMITVFIDDPYKAAAAPVQEKETPAPAQQQSEAPLERAKELRTPLYSDAVLDEASSSYRNGELMLMMTSGSPVEQIASFYEKATGVKRHPHSTAASVFILAPKAPLNQILQVMVWREEGAGSSGKSKLVVTSHAPIAAPTEKELGLPIYKGALFNVESSTANHYAWTSNDTMEAILSFYEQASGQKRAPGMPADTGVIVTPGASISVQGNADGLMGPGKVGIMIVPLPGAQAPRQAQQKTQPRAETAAAEAAAPAQQQAQAQPQPAPKAVSLLDVARSGKAEDIRAAIRAGARIDEVDASGYTPLMQAAMSNPDPAVITLLVAAGASVDARGPNQGTALMFAAKSTKKAAVVQALLDAHANMKLKDAAGKTAFDYATGNSALMFSPQLAALGLGRF